MAYVSNPWMDDEDEQNGQQIIGGPGDVLGTNANGQAQGGASGTEAPQLSRGVSGSQTNAVAAQPGAAPKGSGSWTNLNSYLDANRGAGTKMAGAITDETNNQIKSFQDKTGQVETGATSKIKAGGIQRDAGLEQAVRNDPISVRDKQREQFSKVYNAEYGGPKDVTEAAGTELADLNLNKGKIDNRLTGYETDSGRRSLLTDTFKPQRYSQGESALDGFFLQADGGQTFQKAKESAKGYDVPFSGLTSRLQNTIQSTRDQTNEARNNLRSVVSGETGKITGSLANTKAEIDRLNADKNRTFDDIAGRLSKKDLKLANIVGIDPETAQWALANGFDLSKLVERTKDLSLGDRVDEGTVSRLAALQDLQGSQDPYAGFDFTKAGGTTEAINKRNDLIQAARQGRDIQNELNLKRDQINAQRNEEFGRATQNDAIAKALGMSPQEIAWLVGGGADQDINYLRSQTNTDNWSGNAFGANKKNLFKEKGGAFDERKVKAFYDNIRKEIQRNPYVNLGDVANPEQRQQFANLVQKLGITGPNLADVQDEGSAFRNFDVAKYLADLNSKKSAYGAAERDHDLAVKNYIPKNAVDEINMSADDRWRLERDMQRQGKGF